MMNKIIDRPYYLERLNQWRGNGLIKVIMGPRRSGKSFLFRMYRDRLVNEGIKENQIISFQLDQMENASLLDPENLHKEILNRLKAGKESFLFIDEIQECKGFEKVLASLASRDKLDIYVTGSNAYMLSGELATYLTGRYFPLEVLPLSFSEYFAALEPDQKSPTEHFWQYMTRGSFPALMAYLDNDEYCDLYFRVLLSDMIVKDILPRYGLRESKTLENLIQTLASSVGSSVSANKIANTLKSFGVNASVPFVQRYLKALQDCYLFMQAGRFDVRGREALSGLEKYYLTDTGFSRYLVASSAQDRGHMLENVVYLELRRRYSGVYVGKNKDNEIDFVVRDGSEFKYFQVALSVMDDAVLDRELKAFRGKKDNYPCFLLTMDEFGDGYSHDGIKQRNVVKWLLEKT